MREFYQSIVAQIEAWTVSGAIVFKHVDLWNNQTQNEEEEIPFNTPAAFIEFDGINYRGEGGAGVQKADVSIKIHLIFNILSEDDIAIMDTVDELARCLNGFQAATFTEFVRTEMVQDVDHDGVIDWMVSFSTTFTDATTDKRNKLVLATPTTLSVTGVLDIDNDVIRSGDGVI